MTDNPMLYEINTRIWCHRFDQGSRVATLNDIPDSCWDAMQDMGMDYVWLMGIWSPSGRQLIDECCFAPGLAEEYTAALPDWKRQDVAGSPYAVKEYSVSGLLGGRDVALEIREKLNKRGIKLIIDFVVNHFSADTALINRRPEIFLTAPEDFYDNNRQNFFRPQYGGSCFAHGKDPYFPGWTDTVQVNFFSPAARSYMIRMLHELAEISDGVRCDMAMLALNDVFEETWGDVLEAGGYQKPKQEFWAEAINAVRRENPDFKFIGEVYWDMEWDLQQLGFDYTYDKKLMDRLHSETAPEIREHLFADSDYQKKLVRFIENHDEKRSMEVFGEDKAKAAAVIMSTLPGMRLYHEGQFEGKRISLPVQLGREPDEPASFFMQEFYQKLLNITQESVFKEGDWEFVMPEPGGDHLSFNNILCWIWKKGSKYRLVTVNFSEYYSSAHIKAKWGDLDESIQFKDLMNEVTYDRSRSELSDYGLYVGLNPWGFHIFEY